MGLFQKYCSSKACLVGKTAVITGANTGIGKETARNFYRRGARVILACRNVEAAEKAVEDIKNNSSSGINKNEYGNCTGELAIYTLDLCSLDSVRHCARSLLKQEAAIHILVNNAGVAFHPYQKTEDGYETTLQSNHLGHFLLTLLLLPKMQLSAPVCRIVNVSSILHRYGDIHFDDINLEKSYTPLTGYTQSKLANVLFTRELARRLREANIDGINVYSLHPGIISTEVWRHSWTLFPGAYFLFNFLGRIFFKNCEQGAQTTIHCSVDEKAADETGLYYTECSVADPQEKATDERYAKNLWDVSCRLLHLKPEEDFAVFLKTVSHQITEDPDRFTKS